jgi:hypothetical protein
MRAKRNDMCRELQVPRFKSAALTVVSCIILMTTTSHAQRHHKQTDDNGIHVGQPKVYDSRELTLMLDNLSLQLQGTNFINPTSLATALGNVQGYQNSDFSGSLFANGGVGPGAAAAFGGNAVAAATATPATTTAAPRRPNAEHGCDSHASCERSRCSDARTAGAYSAHAPNGAELHADLWIEWLRPALRRG